MKELFTIGEMAELFQINLRTLRYYDDIGLLCPETVNPETGYRYYSTKQFERLNTIKYLRTLNMPLEKMKQFFQNRDARVMEQILEDQLLATRDQLAQLQNMERKLTRRLEQLRYALNAPMEEVRLVRLPKRPVAFLRRQIAQGENLEYPIRELERMNDLKPVMFLGKVGVTVDLEELRRERPTRFSGIFVFLEEEDKYQGGGGLPDHPVFRHPPGVRAVLQTAVRGHGGAGAGSGGRCGGDHLDRLRLHSGHKPVCDGAAAAGAGRMRWGGYGKGKDEKVPLDFFYTLYNNSYITYVAKSRF